MPYYTYQCKHCAYSDAVFAKISDRDLLVDTYCTQCEVGLLFRPPEAGLGTGFTSSESLGRAKAPKEFRDLMSHMKRINPGSTIKER